MRLEDLLRRSALAHPDKVALVDGERRVTYGELEAASDSLAVSLFSHGVQRSDRVAVLMDNGVEPAIALFAILKAGPWPCRSTRRSRRRAPPPSWPIARRADPARRTG